MVKKVCLITGANSGIGKSTAQAMAARGANVVMVCRNRESGEAALKEIKQSTGSNSVCLMIADLASQQSIHGLAEEFRSRYGRLDILINNAGIFLTRRELSPDNLEMTFAVNHLAYFLLTNLLLDLVSASAPARIINVSSEAHKRMKINFDDLQGERKFSGFVAYGQSKLCNILFSYELARRLLGSGVTVNCLHPGVVSTGVFRNLPKPLEWLIRLFAANPERGAATSIYLADSPEVANITGQYFIDCKPRASSKESYDQQTQKRLWQVSEELTQLSKV